MPLNTAGGVMTICPMSATTKTTTAVSPMSPKLPEAPTDCDSPSPQRQQQRCAQRGVVQVTGPVVPHVVSHGHRSNVICPDVVRLDPLTRRPCIIFASPGIVTRRRALRSVRDFQQVVYSSSSRIVIPLIPAIPVPADLSIIQKRYHAHMSPALRHVYLEGGEDRSRAVIDDLKSEIATPKARVVTFRHEKKFSSKRSLAARDAASRLTSVKRAARLAFDKANGEA